MTKNLKDLLTEITNISKKLSENKSYVKVIQNNFKSATTNKKIEFYTNSISTSLCAENNFLKLHSKVCNGK